MNKNVFSMIMFFFIPCFLHAEDITLKNDTLFEYEKVASYDKTGITFKIKYGTIKLRYSELKENDVFNLTQKHNKELIQEESSRKANQPFRIIFVFIIAFAFFMFTFYLIRFLKKTHPDNHKKRKYSSFAPAPLSMINEELDPILIGKIETLVKEADILKFKQEDCGSDEERNTLEEKKTALILYERAINLAPDIPFRALQRSVPFDSKTSNLYGARDGENLSSYLRLYYALEQASINAFECWVEINSTPFTAVSYPKETADSFFTYQDEYNPRTDPIAQELLNLIKQKFPPILKEIENYVERISQKAITAQKTNEFFRDIHHQINKKDPNLVLLNNQFIKLREYCENNDAWRILCNFADRLSFKRLTSTLGWKAYQYALKIQLDTKHFPLEVYDKMAFFKKREGKYNEAIVFFIKAYSQVFSKDIEEQICICLSELGFVDKEQKIKNEVLIILKNEGFEKAIARLESLCNTTFDKEMIHPHIEE